MARSTPSLDSVSIVLIQLMIKLQSQPLLSLKSNQIRFIYKAHLETTKVDQSAVQ